MSMKLYSDSSMESIANSIRNLNNALYNKGYTRIEYIQNTGLEYIKTGVTLASNVDVEIKIELLSNSSPTRIFGSQQTNSARYEILNSSRYCAINYASNTVYTNLNIVDTIKTIKKQGTTFYVDDNEFSLSDATFTADEAYIFSSNRENPTNAVYKLYYCKMYNNNTLIRDFIPCFRNSDNVIGLYDLVNNVFYTNQGTGSFIGSSEYPKYKLGEMADAIDNVADEIGDIEDNISTAISTLNTDLSGDSVYKMITVGKGSNVTLNDTEEETLDDFKILGKTVQNGTPSPSSPVAIENVGTNLFKEEIFLNVSDWSKNSSGYYYGNMYSLYTYIRDNHITGFKANLQYRFSFTSYCSGSGLSNVKFIFNYTDGTTQALDITTTSSTSYTFTSTEGKTISYLNFEYSNGQNLYIKDTSLREILKIKRTDGISEETYSFPLGDTPLMEGDYIDRLGIHHTKGQITFDGSSDESWTLGSNSPSGSVQFYTSKPSDFFTDSGDEGVAKIKCSHFINQDGVVNGMRIGNSLSMFPSTSLNLQSVTEFKTWLSSNPITVEYPLKTPTVNPLTSAQQTVFDEILQDGTYEVVTTYTSYGNLAPDMEINYHKDLQPRLADIVEDVTDLLT